MSDLLKPPPLPKNPVAAISALQDWIWDIYQAVDTALDNTANQLTATSPLNLDAKTLQLIIDQVGAVTGNALVWNGSSWVAGGNQWFSVRSTNPQVSTGTYTTISTWLTPDVIETGSFTFDKTTGELEFLADGEYLLSGAVSAESSTDRSQLEIKGQKYTAASGSWADYSGAEGYGYARNSTQDRHQAVIPELALVAKAGDKFRLQMRDEGTATSILSCVLTAKRRY